MFLIPTIYPRMFLPTDYDIPPTLYSIMNSIVNYGREEKVSIRDLPHYARSEIFDFNYPLSENVSRETFEELILKKFMMKRIGYETMTAFKLALEVKLNEIMPIYNKMFDMLEGWNLFNDGENVIRSVMDSRTTNSTNSSSGISTSDRRFSELPQNQIQDIQDGDYVTDYNYDTNTDNVMGSNNISDSGTLSEVTSRTPSDKIRIYKEFKENVESIYSMIYKDLDKLFYGIVL